jgi:hypothetical protein
MTVRTLTPFRLLGAGIVVAGLCLVGAGVASAAQAPVGLGTTTSFAVLAGQTITNTGSSVITGDLGVSPGNAITGFPTPGIDVGTTHAADGVALDAQNDLTTAYDTAAGAPSTADETGVDLGGQTLTGGVYTASTSMALTGELPLTLTGDASSVFIFQAGSTLITGPGSSVVLTGGVLACNVFWQVGTSATLGTTTAFVGNVFALTSITADTGATVLGRLLARNGAVTLDDNVITASDCTSSQTTASTIAPTTTVASGGAATVPAATTAPGGAVTVPGEVTTVPDTTPATDVATTQPADTTPVSPTAPPSITLPVTGSRGTSSTAAAGLVAIFAGGVTLLVLPRIPRRRRR